ncbi:MAG: hypothetical protein AAB019_01080 [Planctomycetota bacterium]
MNPPIQSTNGSQGIKNFTGWLAVELAVIFLLARLGISTLLYIRQWVSFQPFFPILGWLVLILFLFVSKRLFLRRMPACFRSPLVVCATLGISLIVIIWSVFSIRPFFDEQFWNIEISRNAVRMLARYEMKFKTKTGSYTENLDELGRTLFNNPSYVKDRLGLIWKGKSLDDVIRIKVRDEGVLQIYAVPVGFQFKTDQIVYDSSEPRLLDIPPGFAVTWSFDPGMNSDKLMQSWSYQIWSYGSVFDLDFEPIDTARRAYKIQFPALYDDNDLDQDEAFRTLPVNLAWFLVNLEERFKYLGSCEAPNQVSAQKVWELYQVVKKSRFTTLPKDIAPKEFSTFGQESTCISVRMAGKVYESRLSDSPRTLADEGTKQFFLSDGRVTRFLQVHAWFRNTLLTKNK